MQKLEPFKSKEKKKQLFFRALRFDTCVWSRKKTKEIIRRCICNVKNICRCTLVCTLWYVLQGMSKKSIKRNLLHHYMYVFPSLVNNGNRLKVKESKTGNKKFLRSDMYFFKRLLRDCKFPVWIIEKTFKLPFDENITSLWVLIIRW